MQQVQRGFRAKLEDFINVNCVITADLSAEGGSVYDFSCFGVDADNKLSDDRYMVFYNQTASPNNEVNVSLMQGRAVFNIDLAALPQSIEKLVFTVSADGSGVMSELLKHTIKICQNNQTVLMSEIRGCEFFSEKAIISFEIYRKGVWRINFVGQGFSGGLSQLLSFYGGEEAFEEAPMPAVNSESLKVSLEKKLSKAPALVSLAKHAAVSLEKNKLENCTAKVGLVLDFSGSMRKNYTNGTVQEIINRILPLAVQFDDDGELDVWIFAEAAVRFPSANLDNYRDILPGKDHKSGSDLGSFFANAAAAKTPEDYARLSIKELNLLIGGRNNEPYVMRMVIDEYRKNSLPAYVIFISDGGVSRKKEISDLLMQSSYMPVFWQFVGIGGSNYGILENLNELPGRVVDNASFFALNDFMSIDKTELYNRMLSEFPSWLREAKAKGIF